MSYTGGYDLAIELGDDELSAHAAAQWGESLAAAGIASVRVRSVASSDARVELQFDDVIVTDVPVAVEPARDHVPDHATDPVTLIFDVERAGSPLGVTALRL